MQEEKGLVKQYNNVKNEINQHEQTEKNALLQVETLGMMTKYQLVFVRMETAFSKIFNSNRLWDVWRMQGALL